MSAAVPRGTTERGSGTAGYGAGHAEDLTGQFNSEAGDPAVLGVSASNGPQVIQLLPAERSGTFETLTAPEELVELLAARPREMLLCQDLEYRTVQDVTGHMVSTTKLDLKFRVGEPTRTIQWAVSEVAQDYRLGNCKVRCEQWGRTMTVNAAIIAAVKAVSTGVQDGSVAGGGPPSEAACPNAAEAACPTPAETQFFTHEKTGLGQWDLTELKYFLSSSAQNRDLSSFETGFGFMGEKYGSVPEELRGTTLETWFIGKWFKSRENFFQAMKTVFAATGAHSAANEGLALAMLTMTPKEAKQAGKPPHKYHPYWGGQLVGLDAQRWNAIRVAVMDLAVGQQAAGCKAFAERLLGTDDAWLAEATSDSFWGLGMNEADAARVPPQNRQMVFGKNHHGVALMLERSRLRAARGDG